MAGLLVAGLIGATLPAIAQHSRKAHKQASAAPDNAIAIYLAARRAYEQVANSYWRSITDKRRARFAKRRNGEPVKLDDYVLTQPPVYTGPPRPPGYIPPDQEPAPKREPIPTIDGFPQGGCRAIRLRAGPAENRCGVQACLCKIAAAAGLTREQAVGIYAFETGGNGTYDGQAGIVGSRKDARPISPAMGYNQLLSTNSVSLLAEHGDKLVDAMKARAWP